MITLGWQHFPITTSGNCPIHLTRCQILDTFQQASLARMYLTYEHEYAEQHQRPLALNSSSIKWCQSSLGYHHNQRTTQVKPRYASLSNVYIMSSSTTKCCDSRHLFKYCTSCCTFPLVSSFN